jgi:cytochrome P450
MSTKKPANATDQSDAAREYPYPDAVECPYPFYDRIRVESPVHRIPGQDAYFIALRDDVAYALQHPEIFSNLARNPEIPLEARMLESGVEVRTTLDSDPPTQAHHKQFLLKHFNAKVIREHAPAIRSIVNELIDNFIEDGKCDFVSEFADRVPELVIAELLVLPREVRSNFTEWGRLETSGVRFFSAERKERQLKVLQSLSDYSERVVLERQKNLGNDLLSNFIKAQIERDGRFEPEYTKKTLAVLITAGLLTTAVMLAQGMRLLLQHPDQLQKVVNDPSLIPAMIEETLRIESPAQWIPKRVAQNFEMRGTTMPAGMHACIGLGAANREQGVFPNAEQFDIFRSNSNEHLAFGKGNHFCLGAPLARLEGKIAFEQLFSRLKNFRLGSDNDFKHIDSPSFRGLKKLNIEFDRA